MEPLVRPYRKHIFVCVGERCQQPGQGKDIYAYLKKRLKERGLETGEGRICRSKTPCLGVCQKGPVAVVYPDGIWYGTLDLEKMEQILESHLTRNQPVSSCMIHVLKADPC